MEVEPEVEVVLPFKTAKLLLGWLQLGYMQLAVIAHKMATGERVK